MLFLALSAQQSDYCLVTIIFYESVASECIELAYFSVMYKSVISLIVKETGANLRKKA